MTQCRVLHVIDHSLPVVSGYSVRSHAILQAQRGIGIDARAITAPSQGQTSAAETVRGITYLRTPGRCPASPLAFVREAQLILHLARYLDRVVRADRIEVLQAHSPVRNGLAAWWAARRAGIPVIYELRGLWEDAAVARGITRTSTPRYHLSRALEGLLLRHVDALGVISNALRDEVVSRGVPRKRVFLVPNGVDMTEFHPLDPDPELLRRYDLRGKTVFGFVGFFFAYEGVETLVDAFARRARSMPDARLLLVGSGEEEARLRARVGDLACGSQVIFAGAVPHEEVHRWYSVCDVLVYPRRSNRLTELVTPLKPLEVMAMAKPVVASDVGGLCELVDHGQTGVLFPPGDPEELARTLSELASQPERRLALGARAQRFVCEERTWERIAGTYREVYASVLGGRATRCRE
jgi:PEP-CTERM/exosortase A-associated glycosyltransferase